MVRVILKLALLALPLALSTGCFDDPNAGETNATASSAGETGEACPDGSAGCDCYGNSTCDAELLCEDGTCKLPECVAGSLNCDCYNGECFSGLLCMDGTCKPENAMPGCESVSWVLVRQSRGCMTLPRTGPGRPRAGCITRR